MICLLAVLLSQQSNLGATNGDLSRSAPLQLLDEGTRQGAISELNFVGDGVTCARSSNRGTCSIDAGAAVGDIKLNSTYQTQATVTLYVDTTGSDSNACTSTGTAACLTINGALGKLPRFLDHSATINVAAGTYSSTVSISDLFLDRNITLTIAGPSLTTVTPATGAGTGTLTGFTDRASATLGTMTDTGQSWTTNDLRGRFVRMTSGGASGQRRAIVSNTATALEFAGFFSTDPTAGATYAIESPAASITGQVTVSRNLISGTATANVLTISSLDLSSSSTTAPLNVDRRLDVTLRLPDSRVINTSATSTALSVVSPSYLGGGLSSPSVVLGNGGIALAFGPENNVTTQGLGNAFQPAASLIYSASNSAIQINSGGSFTNINGWHDVVETGSSTAHAVEMTTGMQLGRGQNTSTSTPGLFVRCASGSSGSGFYMAYSVAQPVTWHMNSWAFTNCATALNVSGQISVAGLGILAFVSNTTAISLARGARMNLPATPTFSGVTNEISIDGTAYTYAALAALTPALITGAATQTSIGAY